MPVRYFYGINLWKLFPLEHRMVLMMNKQSRLNAWNINPGSVAAFDKLKQNRHPVILNTDTISDEIATQVFPNYDLRKDLLILFPLITQKNLCGAILIDFTNSNLEINSSQEVWDEKYTLIQGTAHQTAIAIENLQLS